MAKISIYLNSHSSKGINHYPMEEFKKYFFRHDLLINSPKGLDELRSSLKSDVANGVDYIFSVGGDGTANTISQDLIGKNVKLMVVPAGTANDFASEMGVSGNIRKISKIFNDLTTKKVDAIKINDRYMISNGGLGMANDVAQTVNRLRKEHETFKKVMKFFGKETYSFIYAQQLLAKPFKTNTVLIESKDSPLLDPRVSSPLILVNNQEYIGGKFRVAPHTKNDDGKVNVTVFLHKNKMDFIKCTLQMMRGIYPKNDKNLISFETDKLVINSIDGQPLDFIGDGESFNPSSILNIEVAPKALEVCTYLGEPLFCSAHGLEKIEMIH